MHPHGRNDRPSTQHRWGLGAELALPVESTLRCEVLTFGLKVHPVSAEDIPPPGLALVEELDKLLLVQVRCCCCFSVHLYSGTQAGRCRLHDLVVCV